MREHKMSSTAVFAVMVRAAHQTVDSEPRILADPVSLTLAQHLKHSSEWAGFQDLPAEFLSAAHSALALRARYAEDVLKELATAGCRQYVILGAGFDTFAWRQPEWGSSITIFEVDHPATQESKRKLFDESGLVVPANLRTCAVDFETMSLKDALTAARFDFASPAMVSWLGVTQYLTHEAVLETLTFVQALSRGSNIVFSFVVKDSDLSESDREMIQPFLDSAAARGEPVLSRFSPGELLKQLSELGYRKVQHFPPQEANLRYFANRADKLRAPTVEQLMRATV